MTLCPSLRKRDWRYHLTHRGFSTRADGHKCFLALLPPAGPGARTPLWAHRLNSPGLSANNNHGLSKSGGQVVWAGRGVVQVASRRESLEYLGDKGSRRGSSRTEGRSPPPLPAPRMDRSGLESQEDPGLAGVGRTQCMLWTCGKVRYSEWGCPWRGPSSRI